MNGPWVRLLLVAAVAALPLILFHVFTEIQMQQVRRQLTRDEALHLLQLASFEQQRILDGMEQVLAVLGGTAAVQEAASGPCQRALANLLRQAPRYTHVAVMGLDGRVRCAAPVDEPGRDLSGRSHVRHALQTGGFVVGEGMTDRVSGGAGLHAAMGLRDRNGTVTGVMELALDPEWLRQQLEKLPLPPRAATLIADRNGTILARHPQGARPGGTALPAGERFLLEGKDVRLATTRNPDGRPVLAAYSPPGADPQGVLVEIALERSGVLAVLDGTNRLGMALMLLAGAGVALGGLVLGGGRSSRPVLPGWIRPRWGRDAAEDPVQRRLTELTASEAGYRAFFEHAEDSLVEVEVIPDGRFLCRNINPHAEKIMGFSAAAVRGKTAPQILGPKAGGRIEAALRRCVAEGLLRYEETWATVIGTRVTDTFMVPLCDGGDGRVTRVLCSMRDITDHRDLEHQLAEAQKMQALGRLAGGIAHDFNNILQAVQTSTMLIERHTTDTTMVRECAGLIATSSERGVAIVRRLLTFARRGQLSSEWIDPATLLDGLRDILAHTLAGSLTIHIAVPAGLPALLADRNQLETVLINLAVNARDAMPDGGMLTLGAAMETVTEGAIRPVKLEAGAYVRLTVSDTGSGMDSATLAQACEPFFTTKPVERGTGLGLAMARGFAEQSGGALAIESAPGQGTTVTLWLPAAEREATPARVPHEGQAASLDGGSGRVLLVDDEVAVVKALTFGLRSAGFEVLATEGGAAALALLDAGEAVDLLVSDLFMPGMSGLTLIEETRARRPGLPAILLTGYVDNDVELAMNGALSGSFSLLRKPVKIPQLVGRIEAVLARRGSPPA
ncbi:Histidine kinase [Rhodovastum atsumiense]|uniref:histidine kinase n=1 Tax=Rhodovastum atsumiense TaxID=504468 RepID=A0A5M6J053_9PROT|nr:ATP-binding protein [Rhodovastum atsumiense]KAA5613901.1 response regulator [Rhodovastum atsumiense]CAH2602029.1 Histidine kinase [Rhodovastum atsumiense]